MLLLLGAYAVSTDLGLAPDWGWPLVFIGAAAISITLGQTVCRKFVTARFRKALGVRGVPNPLHASIEVEQDALVATTGLVEQRARWGGITEIVKAGPYWVLLAQSYPVYVPQRYFSDVSDELEFLQACMSRMNPDAAERSSDVSRYISRSRAETA